MGRSFRASAARLGGRVCAIPLIVAMALATAFSSGSLALAEPGEPNEVASLVAAVANANQKLQDLGASVQMKKESVNKALVDLQEARDAAAAAQEELKATQTNVEEANTAIEEAQKRFDTFAAATYVNGPSVSYLTAGDPADVLDTAAAGQVLATSAQQVMTDLQQARTEQVNKESLARLAKQRADEKLADAEASQDAAVQALTDAQDTFGTQQVELDRLTAERQAAQSKLNEVRKMSATTNAAAPNAAPNAAAPSAGASAAGAENWDRAPGGPTVPYGDASQWDLTLPAIPSAFVSGDPIAIINASLQIAATSAQVTADLGRRFLQSVGLLPTPTGYTNEGGIPRVYGRQATEYVIQRAMSQIGVPYSWGGGNAAGPSRGIDSGANTVGFDCSGLVLYAFAGVGIKLPHYSGSQYNLGRKIPSAQMRRGDVIFYGPNGSQHVTIYLGNGQMIEAPYTGSHVKISPVRTSGMTPHVVRYIEW
ncbi:NlpC/P60 family peptidoglycan endopeptidase RipA [Mycolicibacterium thermoresistibile]